MEQVGILETHRRLFWARLRVRDDSGRTLLVSTAHLTWHGHPEALATEQYVRLPQTRAIIAALDTLRQPDEPQLFMGDLNDQTEVIRLLREGGFVDCFQALGRMSRTTWPAWLYSHNAPCTLDWIMQRGPIAPMTAEVIDFFDGDIAPSDHKPVLTTYALR